ncbi:ABC transporter substrate-binding protein [Nocardia carnea]|uniref:ABC transporter substrate-binding protein n=1 Tax=Nocardia carnea TaxID=37328 RepID=UPI002455B856|nr:ABC transporter substrate-binding protein [Nocardia carnea]
MLSRLLLAVSALTVVAALLTGCTSAVALQKSGTATELAPGQAPPTGGTARIGVDRDLIPANFLSISNNPANGGVSSNVFDTLVRYSHDKLTPEPRLATEWRLSGDGRRLDLTLRDDVHFHNGKQFTSADVEYTLRTYTDPGWNAQFRRTAATITAFDTSDPFRIGLTLSQPTGNIFDLLAVAPVIDSATVGALQEGREFNGTGPFRFDSWQPKVGVSLRRNDDYWGQRPYLDGVTFSVVTDEQALVTKLRTGQLDAAYGVSPLDAELAVSRGGFRSHLLAGSEANQYIGINLATPALRDIRLRQAIAYAIDRDRILTDVFRGNGYASSLPWPRTSPAYSEQDAGTYRRDVDRARALVTEIGPVAPVPLNYPAGRTDRIIAEIVQSNLADVGIEVQLVPTDAAQMTSLLVAGRFPGLWVTQHGFAQMTPSTLAVSAFPFNATKNASNFVDPQYQAHAVAAWKQQDPTSPEAVASYRALNRDLLDALFLVEIGVIQAEVVVSTGLGGFDWTRTVDPDLGSAYLLRS